MALTPDITKQRGAGPSGRLRIVNTQDGGIDIFSGPASDTIINQDWTKALAKLAPRQSSALFTGAELHCHGREAEILLGPTIDFSNVNMFGSMIGRVLKPGSLIEVLACRVAAFPLDRLYHDLKINDRLCKATHEKDHGEVKSCHEREVSWQTEEKPRSIRRTMLGQDADLIDQFFEPFAMSVSEGATQWHYRNVAQHRILDKPNLHWKDMFRIADSYEGKYFLKEKNGPRFCTELAEASGCIVRAAWLPQPRERTFRDETDLIGDWESWVFDFDAHGLKEVYVCLVRPRAGSPTWFGCSLKSLAGSEGAQFLRQLRA